MKLCLSCQTPFESSTWQCPHCNFAPAVQDELLCFAPGISDGFKGHYFSDLYQMETKHFWFESRNRLIIHMLKKYIPNMQNFLEVGSGTGFVLQGIQQAFGDPVSIYGSELFSEGLKFAKQRLPQATFFQMDARKIPYVQEFDAIGAFDVLEHIPEDVLVLKQLHQAVRPGAYLLVTVPQHPFLWSVVDEYSQHQRRYTRQELTAKVQAAGFKVVRVTSFMALLLPLMLLSRLQSRRQSVDDYDPSTEFLLPKPINATLHAFMLLEYGVIRSRVSLPFGGSLLLLAQAI